MTLSSAQILSPGNPLAQHYQRFEVGSRILLSGHSHQAWPDCGFEAQQEAWLDAARLIDDKWERAFEKADRVREGYRRLLDDPDGYYSLAASTHDLLIKLLSALPLGRRPRLVTTDGEFHSLRRQLDRLEEEGIEIVRVPALPSKTVGDRLAELVDDRTAAVFTSTVFFGSSEIAGDLSAANRACRKHGAILVLDVYHQLNAVPFSLSARDLLDSYVVSAGYKYCQLGEGNAFLRFPRTCTLRPVATGWFAEFGLLAEQQDGERVGYSSADDRFAGATYDPTSHYRGAAVFDFFDSQGLTDHCLREVSQAQIARLRDQFDRAGLDPKVLSRDQTLRLEDQGAFLALTSPVAGRLCHALKERGVWTDSRHHTLRLGPAPYVSLAQIDEAMEVLAELVHEVESPEADS